MRQNRFVVFLTGYVLILVRGQQLEKFINLVTNAGLGLWNIRRLGPEVFQAKMRAPGFLKIRPFIRRSNTVVKIYRKCGWPFLQRRLAARKLFFIGASIFFTFLIYLSSFIMVIKVEGLKGDERQILLKTLKEAGLHAGLSRGDVLNRKSQIEQDVMLHSPNIVWLAVTVRGVVAEVKAVPRKTPTVKTGPGDIIAVREGVISKIITIRGTPLVKEGETVAKGDALISGIEWQTDPVNGDITKTDTAAQGIVEARVWYDWEVFEPKVIWRIVYSKLECTEYKLRMGGRLKPVITFGRKTGNNYQWVRWRKRIYRGRNPLESVELIKDTWYKTVWRRVTQPLETVKRFAWRDIQRKRLYLVRAGNATEKNPLSAVWSEDGNFIKLAVTMEAVETISRFQSR